MRTVEFGPLERRTIGHDFRRSGAVEAIVGGAGAEQLTHAMGNTLSSSNSLYATYCRSTWPRSAASCRRGARAGINLAEGERSRRKSWHAAAMKVGDYDAS